MGYGTLILRIEELLKRKNISKNKICKDLDIPRSNFNRYCRNECQRLDIALLCKLLHYLNADISDLLLYQREVESNSNIQSTPTVSEPLNAEHVDVPPVSKEIHMYSDKYEKILDILYRVSSVYGEVEELYNELCSIEDEHKKYMASIEDGEDEEGEDLADHLNTATDELYSALDFLDSAINSIDNCVPEPYNK